MKALSGEQPLDVATARYRADTVARVGAGMKASAPPDIAGQFTTMLAAVAESASVLSDGDPATLRQALEPFARGEAVVAYAAVSDYTC